MNDLELNNFIKNYIDNDKTKEAIMISAPWGTGKSYYIENSLIPFLTKDNEFMCIVVSAYGLSNLEELSRSIYLETRLKKINKRKELANSGILIGKTIVKGVASFFGVDLSVNESDLQKIYNSVDLSNKLLIIEDLERTGIDIFSLLGYVNNLTVQDGAKVLLIANEEEILKYDTNDKNKQLTNESKKYKAIKEKTIRDTIYYRPSVPGALDSILSSFDFPRINMLLKDKTDDNINSILSTKIYNDVIKHRSILNSNFRSIIFGIQKTIDIFKIVDFEYTNEFFVSVLLSNIAFSLKWKNDSSLRWDTESNGSSLGTDKYPLYLFSYNYIYNHNLNSKDILIAYEYYQDQIEFSKKNVELEKQLGIIYSYYVQSEEDVVSAISYILNALKQKSLIHKNEYGKLGNYLISIKSKIGNKKAIDKCLNKMYENIGFESEDFEEHMIYHSGIELETREAVLELEEFRKQLIYKSKHNEINFDYSKDSLGKYLNYILNKKDSLLIKKSFIETISSIRFIELMKQCSSSDIERIRVTFKAVYSNDLSDISEGDFNLLLTDFKAKLKSLKKSNAFDKIQKMQIEYFESHVDDIIHKIDKC